MTEPPMPDGEGPPPSADLSVQEPLPEPAGDATTVGDGREPDEDAEGAPDGGQVDFVEHRAAREHSLLRTRRSAVTTGKHGTAFYVENYHGESASPSSDEVWALPFEADAFVRVHEKVARHADMALSLKEHHLVVLEGPHGSGRYATAATLIAGVCARYALRTLHRDDGDLLQGVCEQAEALFEAGRGYVVDIGAQPYGVRTLETLARIAVRAGVYVVVIGESAPPGADRPRHLVFEHGRPDLSAVLEAHLRDLLATHRARCAVGRECGPDGSAAYIARLADEQRIDRALGMAASVAEVVRLARKLAECVHSDEADIAGAIGEWRDRLPLLARKLLSLDGAPEADLLLDPHRQAIRIAYACFHGHPLADVIETGDLLSGTVLPRFESRDTAPVNLVFSRDLDRLVPREMRAPETWATTARADGPRRAVLADRELLPALLEVAWHSYGDLRKPLLRWLEAIVSGAPGRAAGDVHVQGRASRNGSRKARVPERIKVRVAEIVGILMRFDFDFVYRETVHPWAVSRSSVHQQCAALALEMAYAQEALSRQVTARLKNWAGGHNRGLHNSAARTYGTTVGLQDLPTALRELRRLGTKPQLASSNAVAFSMASLFLEGPVDPVADELDAWITSPDDHLPQHAVRSMLALGRFTVRTSRRGRPALAELALADERRRHLLMGLLRRALTTQETSARTWTLLERWLTGAEGDDALERLFEEIVPRVLHGPLRGRALFHLGLWRLRRPESPVLRRIQQSIALGTAGPGERK
ncbi:hypothetical protein ACF08E_26160 [Streptomyces globisporus]|uniref:hypothetical protein n=1 Tax=Streptomyces globisporus TaxID=1908 RepID=UPI0036F7B4A7